jgi:DNA repair protein RecO (recombination protein O)
MGSDSDVTTSASRFDTEPQQGDRTSRLYRSRVIVLRRRDIGEADRILTLLTEHRGRMRVVAKGVRRPGSRLAGHLEPYCVSNVLIARTRGLDIISQAETIDPFTTLRANEASIATAGYMAELVDVLVPEEQPQEGVFSLMHAALDLLDRGKDRHAVTFVFQMGLLRELGYRPRLDPCIVCGATLRQESNGFSVDGGVVCRNCTVTRPGVFPLSVGALKLLRAVDRAEVDRVLNLRVHASVWNELDGALGAYITRIAGRELGSASVMRELRLE